MVVKRRRSSGLKFGCKTGGNRQFPASRRRPKAGDWSRMIGDVELVLSAPTAKVAVTCGGGWLKTKVEGLGCSRAGERRRRERAVARRERVRG